MNTSNQLILLTGATGYVGGRLLTRLEATGRRVRCLARNPANLKGRVSDSTEVVAGDLLNADSLLSAMQDVHTAYYLVHALASGKQFEEEELASARNFADAARKCGVKRIIYLGGLGDDDNLSPHLRTRQEVGRILSETGIQTIEFRAGIIIGSGSLSFEIVRTLVGRLPVMITPKWTKTRTQPISIVNVLEYLLEAKDLDSTESLIVEIGGPDILQYKDLLLIFAELRGLKRLLIPVPVLSPRLSSLWLGLITPVYARIGRKLVESLKNETVVNHPQAMKLFKVQPLGAKEALKRALIKEDLEFAETRWSDAVSSAGNQHTKAATRYGSRIVDARKKTVPVSKKKAFAPIQRIGGQKGWYYADFLWKLRGWIDLLIGGPGMRRGRHHPIDVRIGDQLDFWRVEAYEPDSLLQLRAEMKLPGRAWLQFEVKSESENESTIYSTAIFDPVGLMGILYWYGLYPVHVLIFRGMLKNIAHQAIIERN